MRCRRRRSDPLRVCLALLALACAGLPARAQQAAAPAQQQAPAAVASAPAAALGYYRFPAIRGERIVFSAEGDLWTVPVSGGEARRLTTHPAEETNPAISPDGKTLAFTASYEGPAEVYTMPIEGGVPVRHTWDGMRDVVVGWTPDGRVLYATSRYTGLPGLQLVSLDPRTERRVLVPLAQASDGALDPSSGTFYFTRLPKQPSSNRNYRGGSVQSIWSLPASTVLAGAVPNPNPSPNPSPGVQGAKAAPNAGGAPLAERSPVGASAEAAALTGDYTGTSKAPMPWNGRLYFASDRTGGVMNLWSMAPDGRDLKQLTRHTDFEVQSPALDEGRIVYQLGADLWLYDARTGEDRRVPITLASDYEQLRPRWITKPLEWATAAHLSPAGDRVVLTARGQVFVAPVGSGRLVQVTRDESARARGASFLDARTLVAMSDASGEVELWKWPANGLGQATRLTSGGEILRWDPVASPDGHWVAHTDKDHRLWLTDVAGSRTTKIAENRWSDIEQLAWSPDSRWLAYVETLPDQYLSRITLYDTRTGASTPATSDRYDSFRPVFSRDGKWLWFLSDRTFRSIVRAPWGPRAPEPYFDKQTGIYGLVLDPSARFPFAPPDELHPADTASAAPSDGGTARLRDGATGATEAKRGSRDSAGKDSPSRRPAVPPSVDIALDGLMTRLYQVPVPAGNYSSLATDGKRLYYLSAAAGAQPDARDLVALEITGEKPKPSTLLEGVAAFELSADGKKLLVRKGNELYVTAAGAVSKEKLADAKLDLGGWSFQVDPRRELAQMFTDAWRLERDYYWDPQMRGLDWKAVREKYAPLVARVTSRAELSDALAQMVAELQTLHTFVRGGDLRAGTDSVSPASLGARLEKTAEGFRVAHIYRAEPDEPGSVAPLARPGVDVREGDVITAVNGVPAGSVSDLGELLRNQAGKQVLLTIAGPGRGPGPGPKAGARQVVVVPITPQQEADLRYTEWEYTRRLAVDSMSHGRIGYLHLRAMGPDDIAQFVRDYYPNINKDALIVDVRSNRGGNIDSWVLEKLMRRPWMYWQPRKGEPIWNMQSAFRGPMVTLVNEYTASDGEAFAEGFRRLGLGKVLGTRTWGGEIWLSSNNFLVDRGIATAAEIGVYGPEGHWLVEGHGVDPDIVVDNPPAAAFAGKDAQLEAAVKQLTDELSKKPVETPKAPPRPKVTASGT